MSRRAFDRAPWRLLTLAAGLGLCLGACDRNGANSGAKSVDPNAKKQPKGQEKGSGGAATEPDVQADQKAIEKTVAKLMSASAGDVKIEFPTVAVPGMAVFKARVTSMDPIPYVVGVVHQGKVITDNADALKRVVAAWGYGAERTVPVDQVAAIFGILEGADDAWRPIISAGDLDVMSAKRKEIMFLPRESTIDGKPAVQYWVKSAEPPLWMTTAVIQPDGSVAIDKQEHWVF